MTLEIFLGLSLIFNIILGIGVRNLLRQNHQLEDAVLNGSQRELRGIPAYVHLGFSLHRFACASRPGRSITVVTF